VRQAEPLTGLAGIVILRMRRGVGIIRLTFCLERQ
jgi:hypothetical protein